MKLKSIHQYFKPSNREGAYENSFLKTGETKFTEDKTIITFFFGYTDDENNDIIVSKRPATITFSTRIDTIIENENGQPEELRAFLGRDGTYSKEKIIEWGHPSKEDMMNDYLDSTELLQNNKVELTQNEPQRTIAKDWILENIYPFGKKLGDYFEFEDE